MPEVSILIAARNEEATILRCLQAIERLSFPKERLEVLIGNDRSTDRTAQVVAQFIAGKSYFHLFDIQHTVGQQAGKANVLAQLAQHANGRFLFFTDADVAVPTGWIEPLLAAFENERVGVVSGCTQIEGKGIWAGYQTIEWLYAQSLIKRAADWGIPLTALGNNMAVRREAYDAVGGYESLPFSVVEDFQLFSETLKRGYTFRQLFELRVLASSLPTPTWSTWLQQRKRWMVGAFQTPLVFILLFFVQAFFYPLLLGLAFFYPKVALTIWLLKFGVQTLSIAGILFRFQRLDLLPYTLLYEPMVHATSPISLFNYFLPTKVVWKGRRFEV